MYILYVNKYIINTKKYKVYEADIICNFSTHQLRVLTKNRVKKSVFVSTHKKRTFLDFGSAKPDAKFVLKNKKKFLTGIGRRVYNVSTIKEGKEMKMMMTEFYRRNEQCDAHMYGVRFNGTIYACISHNMLAKLDTAQARLKSLNS